MTLLLRLCVLWLLTCVSAFAAPLDETGRPASEVKHSGPEASFKIQLDGARDKAKIIRLEDGSFGYLITRIGSETDRVLTPEEFTTLLYTQKTSASFLETLFNVTGPVGFAWVALGFGGQLLFSGRMLVQWLTSEKEKRSVVPVSFWWMSLIGATMLLVYFIWRRDIVGISGQALGWVIYIRNLSLIYKARG
jgi:lipid-A-disaccharide synthase-like uncharacterized protein